MKRRVLLSFTAATFICAIASTTAQQTDGPNARFDDDLISKLEGQWNIVRQIRGTEVRNRMTATWMLNHQFLQLHMRDVAEPPKYEAIVLIGYIHAARQYVAHWTDTFGGKFSARGIGTRSGNTIEFRFDYDDGPFFNTFTWNAQTGQWTFRMESQGPDGARRLFALDTVTRAP